MDGLRGIKLCHSLKNSFFKNFSRGEQKHFFFGRFTRHKTLPGLKNGNFRAQVTIIADSRFFFWSVYVAHFESLYNNWRLSVIAKIIVQWNEVRLLNRPKKVSAISDSQILFIFFRQHFCYHHNFWTSVPWFWHKTSLSTINFCRVVPRTSLSTINFCRVVHRTSLWRCK